MKSILRNLFIGILFITFCVSLFKHISYPLIWNDESEPVMMATRILTYGYPKVHDEKNCIFQPIVTNPQVGYNQKIDACIYITWGNYYFATIGVLLANLTDDIYVKTALLRIPYATMGLLGLIIFCLSIRNFFKNRASFQLFLILFWLISLFSVSLIYHMREARYFSLIIFFTSCFFYLCINYFFFQKYSFKTYFFLMLFFLIITYHLNFIIYAIFCSLLIFIEACVLIKKHIIKYSLSDFKFNTLKKEIRPLIYALSPVIIASILIIPFVIFFETLWTSWIIKNASGFNFNGYINNVQFLIAFFLKHEFFYTALLIKVLLILFAWITYKRNLFQHSKNSALFKNLLKLSFFITAFFLIYTAVISNSPYFYVRHFIVLQPVMVLSMVIDLMAVFQSINLIVDPKNKSIYKSVIGGIFLFIFSFDSLNKYPYLKEHFYQLTHQYKGPLDFIIPYIKENFKSTETIVIATNFEEYSYMYYLKSKVTFGYINNNLADDLKHQPDIIIYRKGWPQHDFKLFNHFFEKSKYKKVTFPVYDNLVNNIPELSDGEIGHLFRTKYTEIENEKTDIYIKIE